MVKNLIRHGHGYALVLDQDFWGAAYSARRLTQHQRFDNRQSFLPLHSHQERLSCPIIDFETNALGVKLGAVCSRRSHRSSTQQS